jgi:hypothetical protein
MVPNQGLAVEARELLSEEGILRKIVAKRNQQFASPRFVFGAPSEHRARVRIAKSL